MFLSDWSDIRRIAERASQSTHFTNVKYSMLYFTWKFCRKMGSEKGGLRNELCGRSNAENEVT